MPRTKEQNEAIRAEKKQVIMDAALLLFAENSYEHTSIDSIAKHAGISKGLIYSYFRNKEDLLHQILVSGMKKISESFFPEMTMEDYFKSIEKSFDDITEHRDFYKLYTMLSIQPKVTQNLVPLVEYYDALYYVKDLFYKQFGERAIQEMLLLSVIAKGYSIIEMFGSYQQVIPMDILKKTVLDFIKERYKSYQFSVGSCQSKN